ncbi:MAG: hypothetical protein RL297_1925 [Pseudomonadota bacterium]|jgi:subtilisin family serine protease
MQQGLFKKWSGLAAALLLGLSLVACGGGGGGGTTATADPSISSQPQSQTVYAGEAANFSVTATGTGTLTYQWRNAGIAISGATSSTYSIPATSLGDNAAQISVEVTGTKGTVASNNATLTVNNPAPVISTQPAAQSVMVGQTATFAVQATGKGTLGYQWKRGSANITGATSASYTTPATVIGDNGAKFTVVITNAADSVTSEEALLTVTGLAPSITTQPSAQSARAGTPVTFTVAATGTGSLTYQWKKGTSNIANANSASYTLNAASLADSAAQYSVKVSNAYGEVTSTPVGLTLTAANESSTCSYEATSSSSDPLLSYQWHIKNNNLYFASDVPATGAGVDLCMGGLWASNVSGTGVKVNVVDTGLELAHEDLSARVIAGSSRNFVNNSNDPTNAATTGDHGTSVAGLIAASNNTVGGSGVAPSALLMAYNYIVNSTVQTLTNFGIAFGSTVGYGAVNADVVNFSAGNTSSSLFEPSTSSDAVVNNLTTLRNRKGAIFVKSAGNGFSSLGAGVGDTTYCNASKVSCQSANQDNNNKQQNTIVVASLNANGTKSSYSTTGSSIWVSGFGGEYGYDSGYVVSSAGYKPAMLTTDQTGCSSGYLRSGSGQLSRNDLDKIDGTGVSNANCNYTAGFNGTSSAAPTVSGVIALMLQANPKLTWRDVRHILAVTSRRVNPNQAPIVNTSNFGTAFTLEQGWVKNAGGYWYHNWYGFGLVNAAAAVAMAQTFTEGSLGAFVAETKAASGGVGTTSIPFNSTGLSKTFAITGTSPSVVEQAELTLHFGSGYQPICHQIELTSPAGTKSIVLHMDTAHTSASTSGVRFVSNAFYGENAAGTWTARFINSCSAQSLSSTTAQQLIIRGR